VSLTPVATCPSLKTTARHDGDEWLVSGQKIWTSYATMAQWIFLLARTSKTERKQHGLTVFLVPMDRPGIEVRPIATMLGPHHLNEVFIDDVQVTEADVLGTVDDGWSMVQEVLAFERLGIARYARCECRCAWRRCWPTNGPFARGAARPLGACRALPPPACWRTAWWRCRTRTAPPTLRATARRHR
jgi:alkylation response protein AidB-like acyl-CoA dehydrogenase